MLSPEKAKSLSIEKTPLDRSGLPLAAQRGRDGGREALRRHPQVRRRRAQAGSSRSPRCCRARRPLDHDRDSKRAPAAWSRASRIDNPAKLNILTPRCPCASFADEHACAGARPADLRAVVITGAGEKAFIGGADLDDARFARSGLGARIHRPDPRRLRRGARLPGAGDRAHQRLVPGRGAGARRLLRPAHRRRHRRLRHARSAPRHPLGGRSRAAAAPRRRRPRALAGDDRRNDRRRGSAGLGSGRKDLPAQKTWTPQSTTRWTPSSPASRRRCARRSACARLWEEAPLAESIAREHRRVRAQPTKPASRTGASPRCARQGARRPERSGAGPAQVDRRCGSRSSSTHRPGR